MTCMSLSVLRNRGFRLPSNPHSTSACALTQLPRLPEAADPQLKSSPWRRWGDKPQCPSRLPRPWHISKRPPAPERTHTHTCTRTWMWIGINQARTFRRSLTAPVPDSDLPEQRTHSHTHQHARVCISFHLPVARTSPRGSQHGRDSKDSRGRAGIVCWGWGDKGGTLAGLGVGGRERNGGERGKEV